MNQDAWNRDDGHLAQGARMIAAAVVSAVVTATLVIAIGQAFIGAPAAAVRPAPDAILIRAGG